MPPNTWAKRCDPVSFSGRWNNDLMEKVRVDQCAGFQNSCSQLAIVLRVSKREIVLLLSFRRSNREQCLIHFFNSFRALQDTDVIFIKAAYGNRLSLCFES